MPFQKKVKDPEPIDNGTGSNASVAAEKNEKKESNVAAEVKAQKELYKKNQENEELRAELAALKKKQAEPVAITQAPDQGQIEELRAQINLLSSQVRGGASGGKLMFRSPVASDLIPTSEAITFTARSVIYIVASYMDKRGLECLPPFKLIIFLRVFG